MAENVYVGNADEDAPGDRGWLLGHFKRDTDPRHSTDVEIKWGVHPRGDERPQWVTGEKRTALLILISGRFRMEFPGRSVVLAKRGDYVVWASITPGTPRRNQWSSPCAGHPSPATRSAPIRPDPPGIPAATRTT